jgi:hypothetical protein
MYRHRTGGLAMPENAPRPLPIASSSALRLRIQSLLEVVEDPKEIAQLLIQGADMNELMVIALATLPPYIKGIQGEVLRAAPPMETRGTSSVMDGQGRTFASSRLQHRFNWYERQLNTPVSLDGSRRNRKAMRLLTAFDLDQLIEYRSRIVEQHIDKIRKFREIQNLLVEKNKAVLGELSPEDLMPLLKDLNYQVDQD